MIYKYVISVTFDPVTEAEEIKRFMAENPEFVMIESLNLAVFVMTKTVCSQKEE